MQGGSHGYFPDLRGPLEFISIYVSYSQVMKTKRRIAGNAALACDALPAPSLANAGGLTLLPYPLPLIICGMVGYTDA
jgi:hypothetical protein